MKPFSIAILGGGPGGLFTAHLLQQRSPVPLAVTIFEAGDRLGGKVRTGRFATADVPYEIGAAELYDYSKLGQDPLRELVDELGLKTHPMRGETVVLDGRILKTNADLERAYGSAALRAFKQFCKYARNAISPAEYYESDWKVDNEDPLTNCSFRALLDKVTDPNVRRYIEVAVHSDVAAEPHRTHASYGLQNWLMNEPGYMTLYTVDGGNQRITDEVAQRVAAKKLLRHRVTAVGQATQGGYEVTSTGPEGERTDRFDCVVAALPNHWLPAIRWRGEKLERAMERHHRHYDHPAHYLRVTVLFRTPFWRNQNRRILLHDRRLRRRLRVRRIQSGRIAPLRCARLAPRRRSRGRHEQPERCGTGRGGHRFAAEGVGQRPRPAARNPRPPLDRQRECDARRAAAA